MKNQKPFTTYFGGKESPGVYHQIINTFPPHTKYVEGFLGNGAILRNKKPAQINIAVDRDERVINKFKALEIPGVNFIHENFLHLINFLDESPDTLIYLDPPYLKKTIKSKTRYNCEMTEQEHEELCFYVAGTKNKIVLSCYENDMYASLMPGLNKKHFQGWSHKGKTVETIYYNFEIDRLHQTDLIGKDFTDRQRIKRKIQGHINKLHKLPALERQCLIDSIISEFRN